MIPKFSTVVERNNHTEFLALCRNDKPCSFPIDVTYDHHTKVWRDGGLMGEVVALPWKRDKDEWPLYPVMNDIVTVLHGSEWTPDKPSECIILQS